MTFSDKKDEIEEHFKSGHNKLYCVLSKRVMVNGEGTLGAQLDPEEF